MSGPSNFIIHHIIISCLDASVILFAFTLLLFDTKFDVLLKSRTINDISISRFDSNNYLHHPVNSSESMFVNHFDISF